MAGTTFISLLNVIASGLQRTAGVVLDDIAVGAGQVAGIPHKRELPAVARIARGSLLNKAIIIPAALGLSAFAPWAVVPLLTLGGAYLSYEGVEKVLEMMSHEKHGEAATEKISRETLAFEKKMIREAVGVDRVLSGEIILVALGMVAALPLLPQLAVLSTVGLAMTVGVYGAIGLVVKLDDMGRWLERRAGDGGIVKALRKIGNTLEKGTAFLTKILPPVGAIAMLVVGGGLLMHGIPAAGLVLHAVEQAVSGIAGSLAAIGVTIAAGVAGGSIAAGAAKVATGVKTWWRKYHPKAEETSATVSRAPSPSPEPTGPSAVPGMNLTAAHARVLNPATAKSDEAVQKNAAAKPGSPYTGPK